MMMKKKIIRVSTVPISLDKLLQGQLKMLSEHYEIVAVSSPGEALSTVAQREGVRTIALPMERKISIFRDMLSLLRMIALLLKERPDAVHSLTPKAGLITMLAGWVTRVPVRMHSFTGLIFPTSRGVKKKILILMDKLLCACATHINPEGEGVKKDLLAYGITKKEMIIIANGNINGIDTASFNPAAYAKASDDILRFCFIGRLVGDKGVRELVEAFSQVHEQYGNTELLLIGSFEPELDPLPEVTMKAISEHAAIIYEGYQSDVRPYLAKSDVLILPSYREGFPNVVLQAGSMGLPQIVTDINGSNEIIIEGQNGLIIQPQHAGELADAMKYLIQHNAQRLQMASNARKMIASRYEQKMVWAALLKQYQSMLTN